MGYYAGGYYAGGYYAGGIFGSLFTGVKKVIGGAIGGAIKGGPIGAITGAVKGTVSAVGENTTAETVAAGGSGSALTPELRAKHAAALARGGAGGGAPKPGTNLLPMGGGGMMIPMQMMGGVVARMPRLHPNKSTYVTRGGGTSHWPVGISVHVKGTELVKVRRMNVANPRALRRALRRAHGFAKLARRYITVTRHFKKIGRRRAKR